MPSGHALLVEMFTWYPIDQEQQAFLAPWAGSGLEGSCCTGSGLQKASPVGSGSTSGIRASSLWYQLLLVPDPWRLMHASLSPTYLQWRSLCQILAVGPVPILTAPPGAKQAIFFTSVLSTLTSLLPLPLLTHSLFLLPLFFFSLIHLSYSCSCDLFHLTAGLMGGYPAMRQRTYS